MKPEKIYKFECGCIGVAIIKYKKKLCPEHSKRAVLKICTCIDCGLVFEIPMKANTQRCKPCQKLRSLVYKVNYNEWRARGYSKDFKDYDVGTKPRLSKRAKREVDCLPRRSDCEFYSYCMFRSDVFKKDHNACQGCKKYRHVGIRQTIASEYATECRI